MATLLSKDQVKYSEMNSDLRMFLGIFEFTVENKNKLLRENCVENMVSNKQKKAFMSTELLLEKVQKLKKIKN